METKKIWTVAAKTQPSNWDIENGFVHSIFWGDSERGSFKSKEDAQAHIAVRNERVASRWAL
jgi:hypothetical protein